MRVKQAKAIARQWVTEKGAKLSGFGGAYLGGSILWLPDDADLALSSDVDLFVLLADPPPIKLGKIWYRDVLLEVSYVADDELESPAQVLSDSFVAGSFQFPNVLLDPSGKLSEIQATVSRQYAKRRWVQKRCKHAREKALRALASVKDAGPFHEQVSAWLFGTSLATHVLLVAGLENPTVRLRYLATRRLLAEYGHLDFYDRMLEVLGCARWNQAQTTQHLTALSKAFDVAKNVIKTPYRFASDISDVARPVAIDGSRQLIRRGFQREAVFYMVATYSRCQHILSHDAPQAVQDRFSVGYRALLADLGMRSSADLLRGCDRSERFLPDVWGVAEAIMAANPGIED
jgi:hypothetical protein